MVFAQLLLRGGERCSFGRVCEAAGTAASLRTTVIVFTAVILWERK